MSAYRWRRPGGGSGVLAALLDGLRTEDLKEEAIRPFVERGAIRLRTAAGDPSRRRAIARRRRSGRGLRCRSAVTRRTGRRVRSWNAPALSEPFVRTRKASSGCRPGSSCVRAASGAHTASRLSSRPSSIWYSGVRSVGFLSGVIAESGCGQSEPHTMRSALAAISAFANGTASG